MGGRKMEVEKPSKPSLKNPSKKRKLPLGPIKTDEAKKRSKTTKKKKQRLIETNDNKNDNDDRVEEQNDNGESGNNEVVQTSASTQLRVFLDQFQSGNGIQLSSLELEAIKDTCILELSQCTDEDAKSLGKDMKVAFGPSWKEVLCEKQLLEGKVDPGCPAILIISSSAMRSIELLRGLQSLTKECPAVKLFSKHMKVEDQVSLLKNRVNIASGTPSRIKKLIDIEALGLSRLAAIVLDVRPDVKGYSLFTLPQVRDEFWDLYKNCFHQRIAEGSLRLGLYGQLPNGTELKGKKRKH
ncbi:hypothetical protein L484_021737 [Morus notabilis]|uniref:Protein CMSS1 n=1 Tax=Morus notabilis TaxID=981085 RepID=W9S6Z9_9ROSA|nr:protein CMS1 [Morus notabilis]EXC14240.1 hypothetical protein L484_021737 [Morus notabilis]